MTLTPEVLNLLYMVGIFLVGAAVHAKFPFLTWLSGRTSNPLAQAGIAAAENALAKFSGAHPPELQQLVNLLPEIEALLGKPSSQPANALLSALEKMVEQKLAAMASAGKPPAPSAPAAS